MEKEIFVINKVIDKSIIKDCVAEKHEMTFEKLEEMMMQEIDYMLD